MVKRQASQPVKLYIRLGFLLIILTAVLVFLSACQAIDTREPIQAFTPSLTLTSTTRPATLTPSPTISSTQTATLPPSPTPTANCLIEGGQLESASFTSQITGELFSYQVYLPPCYLSNNQPARYPVIYLLHGLLADSDQWIRIGVAETMDALIADGLVPPAIIVMPQESQMLPPQTSTFDDALVQELIPLIDSVYNTRPEKSFRAIGGVSRGAGWAIRIGFENIEMFSKIGAHSLPLFDADGGKITAWLTQTPKEDLPEVFIDIGRDDQEWQTAQAFAAQLDEANIAHEWYLFTGGHTESYWSSHLEQYLRWYTRDW
jgi:enterochelin esterase-like enzyme